MDAIKSFVDSILGLGPSIMLPIILTILGLIFGQKLSKSFRAGLTVGVGFVGINLVIELLSSSLGPAAQAMVERVGLNLDVLDVGWPIGAAIAFGTPVAPILIILIILLNIAMLSLDLTKTMDIDIWNYWHFIFAGSVAYYKFDSMLMGLLVGCLTAAIIFKLADWTAPAVEHHFGLPGVSLPHTESVNFAPIMYSLNKIEDKIPGFNKLNANPETIQKRFGIFGEPIVMGVLLGVILGVLGGYDVAGVLDLGIKLSAVLVLLPRMVSLLMEGLIPISEGSREFIQKRFPGKEIYIGLDAAIVVGHPAAMAISLLMVPVTILLAAILPYNRMLPFADLAGICYVTVWAVAASRGNIVRGMVNSIITMALIFYIGTDLAGLTTTMGKAVGFNFPEGTTMISGIDLGGHVIPWIMIKILDFKNRKSLLIGLGSAIVYGLLWYWVRNDIKKQFATEIAENENMVE